MLELTNQQGGVFEGEVFDEEVFDVGIVWRRQEPDTLGWARLEDPLGGGYGSGSYGGGLYGALSNWTRAAEATDGWARV